MRKSRNEVITDAPVGGRVEPAPKTDAGADHDDLRRAFDDALGGGLQLRVVDQGQNVNRRGVNDVRAAAFEHGGQFVCTSLGGEGNGLACERIGHEYRLGPRRAWNVTGQLLNLSGSGPVRPSAESSALIC